MSLIADWLLLFYENNKYGSHLAAFHNLHKIIDEASQHESFSRVLTLYVKANIREIS